MRKVAIYVRVSTREQAEEGYSIGAQLEKLRAYCDIKGWIVVEEYVDAGYSGGKLERPAIQKLIKDIKSNKFDMVLVYKLDRLSRSQKDTLFMIEDVFHPNNVKFSSIQENFDTSTPLGMAMAGILSVFAQLERAQIKERMSLGAEARASEGLWHGGGFDPIGYDYIKSNGKKGGGRLVINEYEALQIRKIFDLFEAGESVSQIRNFMHSKYTNKHGSWKSTSSVYSVLETPVACGMIKAKDGYIQGQHEAIIPIERFNRVQELMRERRKNMTSAQKSAFQRTSILAGLLFCGNCGARYYIKTARSGRKEESQRLVKYYCCYSRGKSNKKMIIDPDCKNVTIREDRLDQMIIDEICKLQIEPDMIEEIPETKINKDGIDKKIVELTNKRKKLIDLYLIDAFPMEEIQSRLDDINNQIEDLEREKTAVNEPLITMDEAREIVSNARNVFETGSFDDKVALIKALIEQIFVYDDRIEIHWTFE